ncbi:hypothetical protein BCV70DRAFT_142514, partial [Testicularia cyperi]
MQATRALRGASRASSRQLASTSSNAASRSSMATYANTVLAHSSSTRFGPGSTGLPQLSDTEAALRRQRALFQAVRGLHQTHMLLRAADKSRTLTPASQPAPKAPSTKTPATTAAQTSSASTPAPTGQKSLSERAKELWATAKYLFKFYFNGVKQIWANRTKVGEVEARVKAGGEALTREEFQLIRTHKADMRKLPLFLFILLILEEALPLVVIWAPSLLPSTCVLPSQLTKIRMADEVKRAEAYNKLQETPAIKALLPVIKDAVGSEVAQQQPESDALSAVSSEELVQIAKMYSLATWGGSSMVRRRLESHLAYLREDDAMMSGGGSDSRYRSIPQHIDALAKACSERGLRSTGIEPKEMFETLRTWVRFTTALPDSKQISTPSLPFLSLQLYNPAQLADIKSSLEQESQRGLIDKTKDVLREVVAEEKKVLSRDESAKLEVESKHQQQ